MTPQRLILNAYDYIDRWASMGQDHTSDHKGF